MKRIASVGIALLAALIAVSACSPSAEKTESLTLAVAPFESLALVHVAEDQHLFADNGVRVRYRQYATGAAALEGVIKGEADLAAGTSEFPLVRKAFDGAQVSALATIDKPDFIYLIGRRDAGIGKPADLKGKRIGTPAGSISQFYLGRFLELNKMSDTDITFVDLKTPEEWRPAIQNGTVDAVVLAQPEASFVRDRLGANGTFFSVQGSQPAYTLVIGKNDWIAKNPGAVRAFLTALSKAEEFVESNPTAARDIVQRRLNLDPSYMDLVDRQNTFALSLDQSLILAMEDEARWLMRSKLTSASAVPDFHGYVNLSGLQAVKPEAVNIER